MHRTFVCDLRERVGQTVTVRGWVNARRLQRAIQFVILRDPTGLVQITHKRAGDLLERDIDSLTDQSAIVVTGRVVDNPAVKLGGLEIVPERVDVLGPAQAPLPVDEHSGGEHRLDWRYLDVRLRPTARLVLEVASTFEQALREFAHAEGFTEMHTPKLMGTASESGAEVFAVRYFGGAAYLAQSPQFYKQMAIAAGIERVLEIGPVFRAEPSFTSRHATEFISVDAEMAWIDSADDVMVFEERMLAHALAKVAEAHGAAIAEAYGIELRVPRLPFPRITMTEALQVMRKDGWDPAGERADLDPEGERGISAHIARQAGHEFVFVTGFPASVRPFYHMRPAGRPDLTLSFDLLWKGLEITTGAQREHRYEVLLRQAAEKGMSTGPMQWYLDCFRYGCPPHGGLGMGLSRVLMAMLGLDSIRDTMFGFRGPNRLTP
jgi:nondiscriminating aspartyl-tRNA synthetase